MACGRSVKLELEAFSGGGVTEFQEVVKAAWKLENTAPSDIVMGFTRLPRWTSNTMRCGKSLLFKAARPLRIWTLHLSAMGHRPKLLWLSRSERFYSENPQP